MHPPDLVFFVTAPWSTISGDYLELERFQTRYPSIDTRVVNFNDPSSEVAVVGECTLLRQDGCGEIDLGTVKAFVYFPLSFEPEDLSLRAADLSHPEGHYDHRQWRVITQWIETSLPVWGRCLNQPQPARATNNKLIQRSVLRPPLMQPPTWVGNHDNAATFLSGRRAVAKNLSEGNHVGEFVGQGRRLTRVTKPGDDARRETPIVFQERIDAPVELRSYVIGDRVYHLEFSRAKTDERTPDVRAADLTIDDVRIFDDWHHFDADLIACSRRLQLDYAVFDMLPRKDVLYVLEVNSNGVWVGRTEAATPIRDAFHEYVANLALGRLGSGKI